MPITPQPSPTESARFGRPVARLLLEDGAGIDADSLAVAVEGADFDVVIMRYPNRDTGVFSRLMGLSSHQPLFADCLMYWECTLRSDSPPLEISAELTVGLALAADVGAMLRPTFADYPNHYAANPLFDPDAVLEGYVEWVTTLVAAGNAKCLTLNDDSGRRAGFSVIDFYADVPDIRLAGIEPEHRGHGYYHDLIAASMNLVKSEGHDRIAISTQAHNVAVMSTWAHMGWTPKKSVTTVHLVRRGLLPG